MFDQRQSGLGISMKIGRGLPVRDRAGTRSAVTSDENFASREHRVYLCGRNFKCHYHDLSVWRLNAMGLHEKKEGAGPLRGEMSY